MPYVRRDNTGRVVAVFAESQPGAEEALPTGHPDIQGFLTLDGAGDEHLATLSSSDAGLIRVIEDLIDILVDKHVIMLTDLPQAAQEKLLRRKRLRRHVQENVLIEDDLI